MREIFVIKSGILGFGIHNSAKKKSGIPLKES